MSLPPSLFRCAALLLALLLLELLSTGHALPLSLKLSFRDANAAKFTQPA